MIKNARLEPGKSPSFDGSGKGDAFHEGELYKRGSDKPLPVSIATGNAEAERKEVEADD